jgi:undecaprenyl-diphosphatase
VRWSDLSPKTRQILPLVCGGALAFGAALGFLELGGELREGEVDHFDDAVLVWLSTHRSPALTSVFLSLTAFGSWPVLTILTAGTCVATWLKGERRFPLTLLAAVVGAPFLSWALKSLYGRQRPSVVPHLETVASASFPSGHTVSAVTFFVTLALLISAHTPKRRLRLFLVGYALAIAALVAVSRMYLGVHYPSDVAGGALIGIAWSLVCVIGDRLLRGKAP